MKCWFLKLKKTHAVTWILSLEISEKEKKHAIVTTTHRTNPGHGQKWHIEHNTEKGEKNTHAHRNSNRDRGEKRKELREGRNGAWEEGESGKEGREGKREGRKEVRWRMETDRQTDRQTERRHHTLRRWSFSVLKTGSSFFNAEYSASTLCRLRSKYNIPYPLLAFVCQIMKIPVHFYLWQWTRLCSLHVRLQEKKRSLSQFFSIS